jgi:hypothetical protein
VWGRWGCCTPSSSIFLYTDKKENEIFPIYEEIQWSSFKVMRKSFLIYEEMRKYLTIYEEAASHV